MSTSKVEGSRIRAQTKSDVLPKEVKPRYFPGVEALHLSRPFHTSRMGELFRLDEGDKSFVIRRVSKGNSMAVEVARAEFNIASKTKVPGITPYHETFEDSDYVYLKRTWVPGRDLKTVGKVPDDSLVNIMDQICTIITRAHAKGFAIVDLKPSNIILKENGKVVIVDLGGANYFGNPKSDAHDASRISFAVGTHSVSAPEAVSHNYFSPAADTYALGILACYLSTGKLPEFDITDLKLEYVNQIVNKRLREVVQKAITFSPKGRYQLVGEFKAAFDEAVGVKSVQKTEPPVEDKTRTTDLTVSKPSLLKHGIAVTCALAGIGVSLFMANPAPVVLAALVIFVMYDKHDPVRSAKQEYDSTVAQETISKILDLRRKLKLWPHEHILVVLDASPDFLEIVRNNLENIKHATNATTITFGTHQDATEFSFSNGFLRIFVKKV